MPTRRFKAVVGSGMVTSKETLVIGSTPGVPAVSKVDVEMLQDLIVAALHDAHRKADEAMSKQMQGMMGGMKIPGLF